MMTLAAFDALSQKAAVALLRDCCGSREWAARMARGRPFASLDALLQTGDRIGGLGRAVVDRRALVIGVVRGRGRARHGRKVGRDDRGEEDERSQGHATYASTR